MIEEFYSTLDDELTEKQWKIKNGILLQYNGTDTDDVIVPEGVEKISFDAFRETIKKLILPKSLKEVKPEINARKINMFGQTKINFNIISTQEKIEEIIITNIEDDENIINTLESIIRKKYYFSKLKRIVISGDPIKEQYQKTLISLKEQLNRNTNIELIINKEFEIEDGILKSYHGNDTDIIIPEGVKRIGYKAFYNCGLTSVLLPESLKEIEPLAFANNFLSEIIIPDNVYCISDSSFLNNNIKKLKSPINKKSYQSFVYGISCLEQLTLYCLDIQDVCFNHDGINRLSAANKKKLTNLKELTLINYPTSYMALRYLLSNIELNNLNVHIKNNYNKIITYTFESGKLIRLTINSCENLSEFFNEKAPENLREICINNSNGEVVKQFINCIKSEKFKKLNKLQTIIIKGQNISFKEKLEINRLLKKLIEYRFESQDKQEETTELQEIEDEEISKLLNQIIKELDNYTNKNDKNKVISQVNKIIYKYKEKLKKIKPVIFKQENTFGEETPDPITLKMNLIINLNDILTRLKNNNIYCKLKTEIIEIEKLLQDENIEVPTKIENTLDKIKYIIGISNKYKKYKFIEELQLILNKTNEQISKSITSFTNNIELVTNSPNEETFKLEIDKLYEKVKRIEEIEYLFNNETSDLAKDIKKIKEIISSFSNEHQKIYYNKLNNIINKYYLELIDEKRNNLEETILEIRKEWHPLIEELNTKANTYIKYKELIDELNNEQNDKKSAIEDLIKEINNLIENSNLEDTEKEEIQNKLRDIIYSWKDKLINNYEPKEEKDALEEIYLNNNISYIPKMSINNKFIEIEIQIAKDLIKLKNEILTYLQFKEEYEKINRILKNLNI